MGENTVLSVLGSNLIGFLLAQCACTGFAVVRLLERAEQLYADVLPRSAELIATVGLYPLCLVACPRRSESTIRRRLAYPPGRRSCHRHQQLLGSRQASRPFRPAPGMPRDRAEVQSGRNALLLWLVR